jgi:hypothetical protein
MIIDYKGIKFDKNRQNELATGVVTQIGWDDEKHTIWPWDLAAQAGLVHHRRVVSGAPDNRPPEIGVLNVEFKARVIGDRDLETGVRMLNECLPEVRQQQG